MYINHHIVAMDLTELKRYSEAFIQNDDAVRESEQNLKTLLRHITDFILIIQADPPYTILDANQAALNALGYSIPAIRKLTVYDLHHEKWVDDIEACLTNNKCEIPLLKSDKNEIPVVTNISQFEWDGIPAYVCVARDMTERIEYENELNTKNLELEIALEQLKSTEDSLRQQIDSIIYQNILIRAMCDNVPDMIWAKDINKNYIFTNKSIAERLLNASNTREPVGKNDIYFAERERQNHPDNEAYHTFGEMCQDSDDIILKTEQAQRFQEFGNVKGEFLWLDVWKTPLYLGTDLIGIVGSGRDVTVEKSLQNKITNQKNYLEALLENLPIPVFYKDLNGTFINCNNKFAEFYGASKSYIIGKTTYDLFPEDADYLLKEEQRLFTEESIQFNHNVCDRNMTAQPTLIIKTLHRDVNGEPIGIIGCGIGLPFKDIGGTS